MNREDIIRMAREAGVALTDFDGRLEYFERFAALVAAAEREACAKVCEDLVFSDGNTDKWTITREKATFDCAAAIRARNHQ